MDILLGAVIIYCLYSLRNQTFTWRDIFWCIVGLIVFFWFLGWGLGMLIDYIFGVEHVVE